MQCSVPYDPIHTHMYVSVDGALLSEFMYEHAMVKLSHYSRHAT
jgi:hypothetical protein